MAWICWNKVLASKKYGSLGVSCFYALNRALLFIWVWRFFSYGSCLWTRFIKVIYGEDGALNSPSSLSRQSSSLDIIREVTVLRSKDINLLDLIRKKISLQSKETHLILFIMGIDFDLAGRFEEEIWFIDLKKTTLVWIAIEGLPMCAWNNKALSKIVSPWARLSDLDKLFDNGLSNEELVTERISLLKELHNFNKSHFFRVGSESKGDDGPLKGIRFDDSLTFLSHHFLMLMRCLQWQWDRAKILTIVPNIIGCSTFSTPFSYLGVKVGMSPSRRKAWDEIIGKVTLLDGLKVVPIKVNIFSEWKVCLGKAPHETSTFHFVGIDIPSIIAQLWFSGESRLDIFSNSCNLDRIYGVKLLDGGEIDIPDFSCYEEWNCLVQNLLGFLKAQRKCLRRGFYVYVVDDFGNSQTK
ncbi:hypothetical protein Tco_1093774 [Tanacetum coccineum]|uniref:DUF4283 domain-containing protein n=1 Tax=Tanacetum coccineum TaxID=301880 RepID=A0ABQ5IDN6_9ASTR